MEEFPIKTMPMKEQNESQYMSMPELNKEFQAKTIIEKCDNAGFSNKKIARIKHQIISPIRKVGIEKKHNESLNNSLRMSEENIISNLVIYNRI